jgi:hypothetical protein
MITVTQKDALKAEVVEPGIKNGECVGYKPDVDSKGAALHKFEIEVDYKGQRYPLQDYFVSEKAISMGKNFFIACGFPTDQWDKLVKGEAPSIAIDPNSCVGKKFRVNVINSEYNGRIQSKPGDFLPPA